MSSSFAPSPNVLVDFASAGSACGVWRDALTTYVLSAAHVFEGAGPSPIVQWLSLDLASSGGGVLIADELWEDLPGGGELDAALVRVTEPGPFESGGRYPHGSQILGWHALEPGLIVQICGKHGTVTAQLTRKLPAGETFEGHVHGRLLQCAFLDGHTDPGDSGAAVISMPEGMLVGMHITRDIDALDRQSSLAVAAEDVRTTLGRLRPGFDVRP